MTLLERGWSPCLEVDGVTTTPLKSSVLAAVGRSCAVHARFALATVCVAHALSLHTCVISLVALKGDMYGLCFSRVREFR